jgi:hypothetical protein
MADMAGDEVKTARHRSGSKRFMRPPAYWCGMLKMESYRETKKSSRMFPPCPETILFRTCPENQDSKSHGTGIRREENNAALNN